jgi:hypothetical protein
VFGSSQAAAKIIQRSYPKLPALSIRISRRVGLGVNAYLDFFTSAILAPKSNIAEEGVPTDSPTLKQKREWVVRNSTAGTGQAQEAIVLHRLCHGPGAPVVFFPLDSGSWGETYPLCPLLGRDCPVRCASGPVERAGQDCKGRGGRDRARGCERRHKCPELDGLFSPAFLHRKARSRLCPRTPRSQ